MKKSSYSCFEGRERSLNPIKHVKRWGRNIKYAYQRIRYGYCDRDVWSIDWWFLNVGPNMIEELRDTTHGYPSEMDGFSHAIVGTGAPQEVDGEGMERWKGILTEMAFLLREANFDTCSRENKYEAEYKKAFNEFDKKYGFFGDGLKTKEEKAEEKKTGSYKMFFLRDVPEYKEIYELHFAEEREIDKYREKCKNKGLDMFKEWFSNLWD